VKPRSNPFDEYDDDEFKMRFRFRRTEASINRA